MPIAGGTRKVVRPHSLGPHGLLYALHVPRSLPFNRLDFCHIVRLNIERRRVTRSLILTEMLPAFRPLSVWDVSFTLIAPHPWN